MNQNCSLPWIIKALICLSAAIAFVLPCKASDNPQEINSVFHNADSVFSSLALNVETGGNDLVRIDKICREVLNGDSNFYSIVVADKKGIVTVDVNRGKLSIVGTDISEKKWFCGLVLQKGKSSYHEITRIGSVNFLIKGQKLYNQPVNGTDSTAYLIALVDLERIFVKIQRQFESPVVLQMHGRQIYESNWIKDGSTVFPVTGYDGLEFAVANFRDGNVNAIVHAASNDNILGDSRLLFALFTALLLITILIAIIINNILVKRVQNAAFVELARKKLPPEEHERIHKMAVSHVYCEIKRSIQTHETEAIEKKVRGEIEADIKKKSAG